ncbi:MAG: hypothetical protein EA391_12280 [Balneolaceae bacterium]|nr:MAG: hypothetical protein EA391_12280 [Balneolaceae bacterium]
MKTFSAVISFLILILISFSADAQRLIERGMILNPLANPNVDIQPNEVAWFTQVGGWGSFGSYGFYGDENHAWYQHLGAYVEIYRRENISSLALTGQIEFIADTNNDINFSPRAIFWEEGLLYTRRIRRSFIQFGYYHRCKHDIDNFRFGEERTMVFGSVLARIKMPVSLFSGSDAWLAFQFDQYTITWEKRTPDTFQNGAFNWDELLRSVKVNAVYQQPMRGSATLYLDGYLQGTLLKSDSWLNGQIRIETGKETAAGQIRFGLHAEYLGDSGIPVQPKSVTLIGVGIRIMTTGSIR